MQTQKGIKIKTKDASIVDNIVGFFKKKDRNNSQSDDDDILRRGQPISPMENDSNPRSTTPNRKRIFNENKTPEKAGVIKPSQNNLNRSPMRGRPSANNHSSNHEERRVSFNSNNNILSPAKEHSYNPSHNNASFEFDSRSPSKNLGPNPFIDTQFNKLILESKAPSAMNVQHPTKQGNMKELQPQISIKSPTGPPRHFLGEDNSSILAGSSNISHSNNNISSRDLQKIRQMGSQLQKQKKYIDELKRENADLKRENIKKVEEIDYLKSKVKEMEKTHQNKLQEVKRSNRPKGSDKPVEVTHLEAPKSPFDRQEKEKTKEQQGRYLLESQSQFANNTALKESLPILPEISSEFSQEEKSRKMQDISMKSVNMKSISEDNSLMYDELSSDMSSMNQDSKPLKPEKRNQDHTLLSPLVSSYDQTVKPDLKKKPLKEENRSKSPKHSPKGEASKTVTYIKGDMPKNSELHEQADMRKKKTNPFQEIATDSNKFLFQEPIQSQLMPNPHRNNREEDKSKKDWVSFEDESGVNVSSKASSNPFLKSRQIERSKEAKQKAAFVQQKNSNNSSFQSEGKLKIDDSNHYSFQDFDINDESEGLDFF